MLSSVTGYLVLFTTQVVCAEFSQCYNDVNICLWADGSSLPQSAAQAACEQRNSFLSRITNSDIQNKLIEFRSAAGYMLGGYGFWFDLKSIGRNDWHWIDGSSLTGQ